MHRTRSIVTLLAAATLVACASTPDTSAVPPNYSPIVGDPAPAKARLIVDCVAAAAAAGSYDRIQDGDTRMIRFSCSGPVARAFYDGLAERSAAVGSEFQREGRTYRSTNRVERDLFAVDHCVVDQQGSAQCAVNLNVGEFLAD